jgi:hypothetical protein
MRFFMTIVCLGLVGLVAGCGSSDRRSNRAQDRMYEAQERVADERLNLVNKYQGCVKDAGGNQTKAAACESYLKAADALK